MHFDLGPAKYPAVFVVALLLSLYFTPVIRRAAIAYGVLDRPDSKLKQHKEPVAYLGGVSIWLSYLFALTLLYDLTPEVLAILLGSSIIVSLGLFDDLKVLRPGVKLAGQIVAVLVLVKAGIMIRLSFLPDWAALLLTLFWMVGVTNALNLIDVSDGLAAGVAAISGSFLFVIALWNESTTIAMLTLSLVGSALGFLVYNRPPARIFMGDTGSMLLGFTLGAVAMSGQYTSFSHRAAAIAPVVILGVPIFDTLFVMGVRAWRRLPLMQGSPDHFAVRLRRNGVSAARIAGLSYVASAVLGTSGLLVCRLSLSASLWVIGGVAMLSALAAYALVRLGRGSSG
ncbi:MAG: undecaprenyl/decaprenyl-phosphate alpha-N-acetylglucosaminyl 1-phosphate transferase [Deltaproteobacteria bacterium]|nr:undecaprenyl/decaprenyl-phosphate alpha-N-acetylglucosaminyl 1-phosphate transferase [Deltaproteobacteria bacterium]